MMKKLAYIFACVVALTTAACSDWIDVAPKTEVETEDLFTSESGFKNALIGIYGRMTSQGTYGRNMTFGYIERLVQRYDVGGTAYNQSQAALLYDYENDNESRNAQSTIWREMYRTIANINNLLEYLETNGDYITTDGYYNLIKGEALGLRAFHYFDLLRLWGPIYSEDPTAKAVPYREVVSTDQVAPMPANELAQEILDDLHQADSLLADDPLNYDYDTEDVFLGERQYRMNRMAVEAMLARVYLWIGDKEQAAYYANQVIEHCNLTLVANNEEDVSMKDETIFGLQMDNMEENLASYWTSEQPFALNSLYVILTDNWTQVFERNGIGTTDIRGSVGRGFLSDGSRYMCRKYLGDEANDPDYYYENIPLIRLSEMYYIYAECVDLAESGQYIDIVRNARGISRVNNYQIHPFTQERQRTEALQNEYSKEFFAEGQYFYFLKRNNISSFYRCPFQRMIYYVLPIPDAEIEYGLVEVKDEVEEQN